MRDLMIDIETLGTAPGSVILSIGAVTFDAESGALGEEFYAAIDPQSAVAAGLIMDVSTLKWWMTQSEDARCAAFAGDRQLVPTLRELSAFVHRADASRVWAKPPSFDLVLLESAYRAAAIVIPWHYRTPRDVRTLLDISGTTAQRGVGIAHNALDDAKSQAADVINAFRALSQSSGIERAARFVEKRLHDYVSEHGATDPDTGTVEYPGNGEEYVYELEEIAEGIRALAAPTSASDVQPCQPAQQNAAREDEQAKTGDAHHLDPQRIKTSAFCNHGSEESRGLPCVASRSKGGDS